MKVVVCYKWVLDETDISVRESDRSLDLEKARPKINDYDRNALELGACWQENQGCELLAVAIGQDTESSVKDVLSRGPEKVYYLDSPFLKDVDSSVTAKVLARIIAKIGNVDVVICGEGSSDGYSQQVGPRLAALLGYACLTYVAKAEIDGNKLLVERKLEDGIEVVQVTGPAVIAVSPEINKPRIPSLKQILAAKKKPAEKLSLEELGYTQADLQAAVQVKGIFAPVMERKRIRINEGGMGLKEAAVKLMAQLKAEKVI